jgi:single-strand DNA-binding protein
MNVLCISGNLTRDAELRSTNTGKQVANFTVAINEGKDKTEFVNCVAWEKTGELISQYCKKGDKLTCSGKISTRTWEKDGEKKYATEMIVNQFDFPSKRDSAPQEQQAQTSSGGGGFDVTDDDLPF